MRPEPNRKPVRPLDEEGLERLALFYAGRFATTRAKLADRLARQKAAAAMLRAGHGIDLVRKILDASPGDVPDLDLG